MNLSYEIQIVNNRRCVCVFVYLHTGVDPPAVSCYNATINSHRKEVGSMGTLSSISVALDLFGAAISLVIYFYLTLGDNRKNRLNRLFSYVVLCTIAILILDSVSWTLNGTAYPLSGIITKTVSFFGYAFMYLVIGSFTIYMTAYFETKTPVSRPLVRAALGLCIFSVLTVILSQFGGLYYYMDEQNLYHRGGLYWLSQVLVFLALSINTVIVFWHRKALSRKEFVSFISYMLLPVAFNVLHILQYDMSWSCIALTLAVLVVYAGIQSDQARRLAEQELALSESRTSIMLSQIKPHFLYNSLNTIGDMCATDPELAQETVFEFADYLRANMDSLSSPDLVPFRKELHHVKTYLALEQKRFSDRLTVEYDIQTENFQLPPLTVQPIAENAVLHGITVPRMSMGTLLIRTEEVADGIKISVIDDGEGFSPEAPHDSSKSHLGIENVRNRLALLCRGSLHVDSTPGKGTTVTIFIPKKEGK